MPGDDDFCPRCRYSAAIISAEEPGKVLGCAVCDARDRAADFKTERDEARAENAALRASRDRLTAELSNIAKANETDWRNNGADWSDFTGWAQNRARAAVDAHGDLDHQRKETP